MSNIKRTFKIDAEEEEEFVCDIEYEEDEYERLKREQEEEDKKAKERRDRMAIIEKRKRYKNEINSLREKAVIIIETQVKDNDAKICYYEDEINEYQMKIDDLNKKIKNKEVKNDELSMKLLSIRNGECDDMIIDEAIAREPTKKVVIKTTKPAKKVMKVEDDDDDDDDTASVCSSKSVSRKKRVNRGKHTDWVRYFGSNTKMRMKYNKRTYYGVVIIDKRRDEYNMSGCKVENTNINGIKTAIKYRKYRLKPADDMPVGYYGDEFNDAEYRTPNDWMEALGCCYDFIRCKKSVWRTCEFLDKETGEWVSLNNYGLGEKVIN